MAGGWGVCTGPDFEKEKNKSQKIGFIGFLCFFFRCFEPAQRSLAGYLKTKGKRVIKRRAESD
jgi:hypothetical protein